MSQPDTLSHLLHSPWVKRCIYLTFCLFALPTLNTTLVPVTASAAQVYKVKGFVVAEDGSKIKGARVIIQETKTRQITDRRGFFQFDVKREGNITLRVIASGYQTQRKKVSLNRSIVSVMIRLKAKPKTERSQVAEAEDVAPAPPLSVSIGGARSSEMAPSAMGIGGLGSSSGRAKGKKVRRASVKARRRSKKRPRRRRPTQIATSPIRPKPSPRPSSEEAGQDEYRKIDDNPYKDPRVEPLSTFSIDVDTASYANMRRFIQSGRVPPVDAVRIEEMINYFDYQYHAPKEGDQHPFTVHTELAEAPWNPEHKLLHIGLQGRKIDSDKLPPSNFVFLLDVSGSMRGPDRLPLLKQALTLLSGTLRPQDKVSIVVYAGAAGLVLPPTPGSKRREIIEAFSKLSAGGSTAGGAGIKLAYQIARENFIKGGNNRVILATDGDFNVGVSSQAELVRMIEEQRKSGVFLTVLGLGRGNYRSDTMSELAKRGNGNHAYIDSILEAQKVLVKEMGGTLFTIAKDVKLQIEFNPAKVGRYRLIGYQSRLLAAEDFSDDKKDAGELGAGHSVTALYEIIPPGAVKGEGGQVDQLKYQQRSDASASESDEWLTVKLRYKKPDGDKSTLLTHPHKADRGDWREASEDYRFSAGVASFAMLLRDSKLLGSGPKASQWDMARELVKGAMGQDDQGYRHELLDLIDRGRKLKLK